MPHVGELCALATALCWTGSSLSFAVASRRAGGLPTNQFRLLAALPVLLALVLLSTGSAWPGDAPTDRIALLAASGLIGLVLGDLGFFHALATIGPRLGSVVMAAWPAIAVVAALPLGETADAAMLAGIALSMAGVVLVLLRSREGSAWRPGLSRTQWWTGLAGALLGAIGQALGVVLAKRGMAPVADGGAGVDPLPATLVRMTAAALGLQLVAFADRRPLALAAVVRDRRALAGALLGTAFGPVLGVWLSMVAVRHAAQTGVAAALMATTPIFMMPVARIAYGARIGWLGMAGTVLVVAGAAQLVLGRAA
jgi:drug/metabolite transporter (DMT)-like permease